MLTLLTFFGIICLKFVFAMSEFVKLFADGIESNPGPAPIKNFIKLAFSRQYHEGDVRGMIQCICNSFLLFAN